MAPSETTSSKRAALRFAGCDNQLNYRADYDDGTATLLNISSTGCAISAPSTPLEVGDKLLLILKLGSEHVEVQARVIRTDDSGFGLRFTAIEEDLKQRLVHHFAREVRQLKAQANAAE